MEGTLSSTRHLLKLTLGQVCTKVASFLEQGQRLENLSWRLWHLQNLMVDVDSAKSKREFKRLSKSMGDKLDKEKGRSVSSAHLPVTLRPNASLPLPSLPSPRPAMLSTLHMFIFQEHRRVGSARFQA